MKQDQLTLRTAGSLLPEVEVTSSSTAKETNPDSQRHSHLWEAPDRCKGIEMDSKNGCKAEWDAQSILESPFANIFTTQSWTRNNLPLFEACPTL